VDTEKLCTLKDESEEEKDENSEEGEAIDNYSFNYEKFLRMSKKQIPMSKLSIYFQNC